jgi:hypothetical protein
MPVCVRRPLRGAPNRSPIGPGTGRNSRTGPLTGVVPPGTPLDALPCRRARIVIGPASPSPASPNARWKFRRAVSVIGPNTASIAPGG